MCRAVSEPSTGSRPSRSGAASRRGEQHDQRPPAGAPQHLGDEQAGVGLDQGGLQQRGRVDEPGEQLAAARAAHCGPDLPVDREQVDPVAGPAGQRPEQQCRVQRRVEPGHVADAARAGPAGVEHEQHLAVALGAPGAHDDVLAPGGGPPVDRAHVVAVHPVAQSVELGALAAHVR